jgi:diguanylate cyclase (GGDEF)-like protein
MTMTAPADRDEAATMPQPSEEAAALLDAVLRQMPVGLTVQDGDGDFLLINDAAAEQLCGEAAGAAPSALDQRRAVAADLIRAGDPDSLEENVATPHGERVLLTSRRPLRIGDRDLLLSTSVDITTQKAMENELSRRAYLDDLTSLPKRSLIEAHVNDLLCRDRSERFALAFIDLDNFKHINDYFGHAVGDGLLIKVAKRLQAELGPADVLARISGDEFLLLIDPVIDHDDTVRRVEHLLQRLKAPFFIEGFEVLASASIGVSLYPDHGHTYETLRQKADLAMYRVKSDAKGAFLVFDGSMEREAAVRTEQEQRLRLAIMEKRFRCAFQPKVDIRTHEIHGVEALVRLCDENGLIKGPGTFIDLAVELGLIDELTFQVVADIVGSLELLDEQFGEGITISINVAAKQAGDKVFMAALAETLKATGCARRFMVEVTEDAFVRKEQFQSEIVPMLREIGTGISIDDFGTGYSSLSALADITADEVKIDRCFITDIHKRPRNQSILRAVESLSRSLGMTVIAEGVETFEELAYLQAATEIRFAQGYYFAKPLFLSDKAAERRADDRTHAARQPQADRQPQNRLRRILR